MRGEKSNITKILQLILKDIKEKKKKWLKIKTRVLKKDQMFFYKCFTSLAIKEMQIKTTVRYHLTHAKMAIINKSINNKCWQGCGERGALVHY